MSPTCAPSILHSASCMYADAFCDVEGTTFHERVLEKLRSEGYRVRAAWSSSADRALELVHKDAATGEGPQVFRVAEGFDEDGRVETLMRAIGAEFMGELAGLCCLLARGGDRTPL